MNVRPLCIVLICLSVATAAWEPAARGQERRDIAEMISQIQMGGGAEVASLLPSLKKSHPDKGGVLFLEALLESDAERALTLYQRVADEHAESAWADDALYRLSQYSYAVGAYRTARSYTERIAKEHPRSPFLTRKQGDLPAPENAGTGSTAGRGERKAEKGSGDARPASHPGKTTETSSVPPRRGTYAVQVGAFHAKTEARKLVDDLAGKGYTSVLREKTVTGKPVFAVWVGVFPDPASAANYARKLKQQQNIDGIVVRR